MHSWPETFTMKILTSYLAGFCLATSTLATSPIVHSKAGIYHGRYLPTFNQDLFLGVKFAPKPVRFAPAEMVPNAPKTEHNASQYGLDCWGYGSDTNTLVSRNITKMGEDCLHLNIVKPRVKKTGLPVLLWIYGGGWQQGATSDPR